jgi:hypothetical protein
MTFANASDQDKVRDVPASEVNGRSAMKRLLAFIIVLTLLVITGTLISADAQTRGGKSLSSRTRVANLIAGVTN